MTNRIISIIETSLLTMLFVSWFFTCSAIAGDKTVKTPQTHSPLGKFNPHRLTKKQPFIQVQGNKLVFDDGQSIVLRGVNVADPNKLANEGKWSKNLFTELKAWGVNVVRLPIHPQAWRKRGTRAYLELVDQAVIWANTNDMYLIIDWHSIGNLLEGKFQRDIYHTNLSETQEFWRAIASRYTGISTIAIYELFNEPTVLNGEGGQVDWPAWKQVNEQLIDIIYHHDKNVIPLVAGYNWAYDLRPIETAPVERKGVAYAVHPYPQKAKPLVADKEQFFKLWQEVWGFAAKEYPIIATELGWVQPDGYGAHVPVKNDGSYGPHIIEFLEDRQISWVVWIFDPKWSPTMIHNWDHEPTEQGAFFKKVMRSKNQ